MGQRVWVLVSQLGPTSQQKKKKKYKKFGFEESFRSPKNSIKRKNFKAEN